MQPNQESKPSEKQSTVTAPKCGVEIMHFPCLSILGHAFSHSLMYERVTCWQSHVQLEKYGLNGT